MKLTFLGSGTSHGIPVVGCGCKVCKSKNPKDKRLRASVYIENPGEDSQGHHAAPSLENGKEGSHCGSCMKNTCLLIDAGPEFRVQALRKGIKHLDGVLITHGHADHLNGLDDLRIFSNTKTCKKTGSEHQDPLLIYGNTEVCRDIHERFSYIFKHTQEGGGKPKFHIINNLQYTKENPIVIKGSGKNIYCIPVPIFHGTLPVTGYLLRTRPDTNKGAIAYITDCDYISPHSIALIKGVDHLVIDGLRDRPHSTHFSFNEALAAAAKICPGHTWFTHICHDKSHREINHILRKRKAQYPSIAHTSVEAAYDGLVIEV